MTIAAITPLLIFRVEDFPKELLVTLQALKLSRKNQGSEDLNTYLASIFIMFYVSITYHIGLVVLQ